MSTQTKQQQNKPSFDAPAIKALPKMAIITVVDEVPEGKETESGDYYRQVIKLRGVAGSRGIDFGLLSRPEWFGVGFKTSSFDELAQSLGYEGGNVPSTTSTISPGSQSPSMPTASSR